MNKDLNIWVFGDSFADLNFNGPVSHQWVARLSNKYTVTNFALAGTGPHWSLDLMIQQIEQKTVPENTACIFVESEPSRLDLKFVENLNEQKNCRPIQCESLREKYSNTDVDNIYWLFENMVTDRWLNCEAYKILGSVNGLAHKFSKVLYWPLNMWSAHYTIQPTKNLTVIKKGLRDISKQAMARNNILDSYNLANHLPPESHDQVYNLVESWLIEKPLDYPN